MRLPGTRLLPAGYVPRCAGGLLRHYRKLPGGENIWAPLMRDHFGAKDPRSMAMKFTSYAHGGETLKEPINNIARIAFASLAYAFGGVQFLFPRATFKASPLAGSYVLPVFCHAYGWGGSGLVGAFGELRLVLRSSERSGSPVCRPNSQPGGTSVVSTI